MFLRGEIVLNSKHYLHGQGIKMQAEASNILKELNPDYDVNLGTGTVQDAFDMLIPFQYR